jgi:hypothetical protein
MGVVAYLDPGSGSIIVATAAAGLAGVGVAAKNLWSKQAGRFRKAGPDDALGEGEEAPERTEEPVSEHD